MEVATAIDKKMQTFEGVLGGIFSSQAPEQAPLINTLNCLEGKNKMLRIAKQMKYKIKGHFRRAVVVAES